MSDELLQIAYNEGFAAFGEVYCCDCPYEGVSESLQFFWEEGWWDAFYDDI